MRLRRPIGGCTIFLAAAMAMLGTACGDHAAIVDPTITADLGPDTEDARPSADSSTTDSQALEADTHLPLPDPDTGIPEPDTNIPEPDTNIPEPDTSIPEPDTSIPEPDTNLADPDMTSDGPPPLPPAHMKRVFIKNAENRNAICNDGSPAAYYARPGTGSNASRWIIHLKGGSHCNGIASCQDRWTNSPELMSSDSYTATKVHGGIFSADPAINPEYFDWTHVYVYYCSSDTWAGNQAASATNGDWHFRGKSIFTALIEDLKALPGDLSLDQASGVLLTGSSAGSAGVINNLDYLGSMIPGILLRGVIDSNTSAYVDPIVPKNPVTEAAVADKKVLFWNPILDESCMQSTGSPQGCLLHDDRPSFIQTPAFVYIDQHDNLAVDKYNGDPALLAAHALAVRTALQPLPGAFSTRKGYHTALTTTVRFINTKVSGVNFSTVLANWLFNRPGPKNVIKP